MHVSVDLKHKKMIFINSSFNVNVLPFPVASAHWYVLTVEVITNRLHLNLSSWTDDINTFTDESWLVLSCNAIVLHGRDNQGVGMARDIIL